MNKIKNYIAALIIAIGISFPLLSSSVSAINVFDQCKNDSSSEVCKSKGDSATDMVQTGINTALYILGIVAVIVIIIGGVKYVVSGGDSAGINSAKNTILYAVVGLVVAIMAYAIVNFVIQQFK